MRPTRRFWIVAVVAVYFAGAAVLFDRALFLIGTAGLGAWLIGSQYAFTWMLLRLDEAVTIEQEITPNTGTTSDTFEVELMVTGGASLGIPLTVTLNPSPAVAGLGADEREYRVTPGHEQIERSASFRLPVAGTATFESPSVSATDQFGLFRETLRVGDQATVTVNPPRPSDARIARGQDSVLIYGNQATDRGTAGLVYHGVRDYLPTDPTNRIDWQATARLGEPKVVEFENATERTVVLVLDRRPSLAVGDTGRAAFDYCREVALGFVDIAEGAGDGIALFVCTENGPSMVHAPASDRRSYAALRSELLGLDPLSNSDSESRSHGESNPIDRAITLRVQQVNDETARRLASDQTAFGEAVRQFCRGTAPIDATGENDPLIETVQQAVQSVTGETWTVILTDDTRPAETREAVRIARGTDNRVFLFLTPSSLFEPNGFSNIGVSYQEYRAFESFRRKLDGISRVTAFELGPGDRLDELLSAARTRQ